MSASHQKSASLYVASHNNGERDPIEMSDRGEAGTTILTEEDNPMSLKLPEPCPHEASEQDVAAQADGLCPLCLAETNAKLRKALQKIADLPPPEHLTRPYRQTPQRIAVLALQRS